MRYLVLGGYAVALHGYPRYTKDIDTTDMEIYNIIIVEKIYKTAFLAFWVLFSQLLYTIEDLK